MARRDRTAPHQGRTSRLGAFVGDPDFTARRSLREAARLGALVGLPFGVVPAALLLELSPQLGLLWPAAASFGGTFLLFSALGATRHRAVVWVAAGVGSGLLTVFALGATAWTLTQSIGDALG